MCNQFDVNKQQKFRLLSIFKDIGCMTLEMLFVHFLNQLLWIDLSRFILLNFTISAYVNLFPCALEGCFVLNRNLAGGRGGEGRDVSLVNLELI